MITKIDILLKISDDILYNKNNYSKQILSELSYLSTSLSKTDMSGELASQYYDAIVNPKIVEISKYWSSNYISKPIFKSLKLFYNNNLDNLEILIMITSIINRSLIAVRSNKDLTLNSLLIPDLSEILLSISSCNLDNEIPSDLIDKLKLTCAKLGLFSNIDKEVEK